MASGGYRLRLLIEGAEESEKYLEGIERRSLDARPVLRIVKKLMERAAFEHFSSEGGRSGEPWLPDKPETLIRKLDEGADWRTEYRHGALAASILGGPGAIRRLSKYSTTVGTRVYYARFQGHRRRLLRLTTRDADRYADIMVEWLLEGKGDESA